MSYLKRYAAPKSWIIARKETKYITKPLPGAHSLARGMPISTILQKLGYADNGRETKKILVHKIIRLDNERVRDPKRMIGLMDTLSLPTDEHYRMMIDGKGRLFPVKITKEQAATKPSRVVNKVARKGGIIQACTGDGRCVADAKAKVGDTIVLSLPDQKVKEHLALAPDATILLTGGRHIGEIGTVESVSASVVRYKSNNQVLETRKQYAFVIPAAIAKNHEQHAATKD